MYRQPKGVRDEIVLHARFDSICERGLGRRPGQRSKRLCRARRLLPLPSVAPVDATYRPAITPQLSTVDSYGSAFIPPKPEPTPATATPGKETGRTAFDESLHDTGWDDTVEGCLDGCGQVACRKGGFFGGVGALVMGRNRANPYWTSVDSNNNAQPALEHPRRRRQLDRRRSGNRRLWLWRRRFLQSLRRLRRLRHLPGTGHRLYLLGHGADDGHGKRPRRQ